MSGCKKERSADRAVNWQKRISPKKTRTTSCRELDLTEFSQFHAKSCGAGCSSPEVADSCREYWMQGVYLKGEQSQDAVSDRGRRNGKCGPGRI